MTSIAMKLKVGTAATAIAIAASVPAVMAPATAAPLPMPATPIQVLDLKPAGGLFDTGFFDLGSIFNNGGGTGTPSTFVNPFAPVFQFFLAAVHQIIQLFCYHGLGRA